MDQENGHTLYTRLMQVGIVTKEHVDKNQHPPNDGIHFVDVQTATHGIMHVKEIDYGKERITGRE